LTGAYVLVIPEFITPIASLAQVAPDPILLDAGLRIGWMSRNITTGELAASPGPELWPREAYRRHAKAQHDKSNAVKPDIPVIANMPECHAVWAFNTSSGAAFAAGMAYILRLQSELTNPQEIHRRMTIAATIGQDSPFCDWWQLGVMNAILGENNRAKTYVKEKNITADVGEMRLRLNDLAREIRLKLGLNLIEISAKNSRFFKANKFLMPSRSAYAGIADQYRGLGQAGSNIADKYLKAANWIWGEP